MLYTLRFFSSKCSFFIMLICLVSVLFTFNIQDVLKLKKNNSGAKGLISHRDIPTFLKGRTGEIMKVEIRMKE